MLEGYQGADGINWLLLEHHPGEISASTFLLESSSCGEAIGETLHCCRRKRKALKHQFVPNNGEHKENQNELFLLRL